MTTSAEIRIGMAGWIYAPWRGSFYPKGLTQKKELEFASRKVNSIELNATFYGGQRPESFAGWDQETPEDFKFSIKGAQRITHIKRLKDIEEPLAYFVSQGFLRLGAKLGPILWQFPPNLKFDAMKFDNFFALLPRSCKAAAEFAKTYDAWRGESSWMEMEENREIRHAVEIRNPSFASEEWIELLRKHHIALVLADTEKSPALTDLTADFVYCRLHGEGEMNKSGYHPDVIGKWARRVVAWSRGEDVEDGKKASTKAAETRASRDVFAYFASEFKERSPFDAMNLQQEVARLLGAHPALTGEPADI